MQSPSHWRSPRRSEDSVSESPLALKPQSQYPFPQQDASRRPSSGSNTYRPRRGSAASTTSSIAGSIDGNFARASGTVIEGGENGGQLRSSGVLQGNADSLIQLFRHFFNHLYFGLDCSLIHLHQLLRARKRPPSEIFPLSPSLISPMSTLPRSSPTFRKLGHCTMHFKDRNKSQRLRLRPYEDGKALEVQLMRPSSNWSED